MTGDHARSIAEWHYAGALGEADPGRDPGDRAALLDPVTWGDTHFAAIDEETGDLAGFLAVARQHSIVDVRLGLRPDRVGRGQGRAFVVAALIFAGRRFSPNLFRVEIPPRAEAARQVFRDLDFTPFDTIVRPSPSGDREIPRLIRHI